MKNDYEVKLYMSLRHKGLTQKQAAARAGMSERTARKYEQAAALPSALKRPHDWQTRHNPFEEDWPWVVEQLERDPALQSTTLFARLVRKASRPLSSDAGPHPAPTYRHMATAAWARKGGDV
jgi:hypothetical protein